MKGFIGEQEICLVCGFCCDGTLFAHASLEPREREHLPERMRENCFTRDDQEYFYLPCPYFSGLCMIYQGHKARVCSTYRCQLLKNYEVKEITIQEAREIVNHAVDMRNRLMEDYRHLTGRQEKIHFRQLLLEVNKMQEPDGEKDPACHEAALLQAKCNIFETLLIKHFRSVSDFENLMTGAG